MRCQLLAAIACFLQLQSSAAAPLDDNLGNPKRDTFVAKRCMTQAEIINFQAHWPKLGGTGPALIPCTEDSIQDNSSGGGAVGATATTTLNLRASEIETLAKRYLADERSIITQSGGMERRCMTEEQISAFQAAWPKGAGRGPALISCPT